MFEQPNHETNHSSRPFGIGGSDIAVILGLSPYKSAVELWSDLVSRTVHLEQDLLHLRFGKFAEDFVAEEYERRTGLCTVRHPQAIFHKKHGFMFGHIDRLVVEGPHLGAVSDGAVVADRLLECKTANAFTRSEWGESGTDRVPPAYLVQCAWYMAITGCEWADLAVLIGNSDLRIYHIRRDRQLEALITLQAERFWYDHVLSQCPPTPVNSSDAALLFPKEFAGTSVEATPKIMSMVREYAELTEESQRLGQECERLRAEVLCYMGSNERLTHRGRLIATWKCSRPSQRLDAKSLTNSHPDIAREFTHTVLGSRQFLLKEAAIFESSFDRPVRAQIPINTDDSQNFELSKR